MDKKVIDGKKIADGILEDLKKKIAKLRGQKPVLAVVLVGDDPASKIYVASKKKACAKIGIQSLDLLFKKSLSEKVLLKEIAKLNRDPKISGILVQLPLPGHINADNIIAHLDPNKDVDGLHPYNLGKLLKEEDCFIPCTPMGVKIMLEKAGIDPDGKHVVIVGRSILVGKPLGALLLKNEKGANATVTIAHSKTKNLAQITKTADILISAVGKAGLITKDMVKKGAVVIDVGINRKDAQIVGDVAFNEVVKIASKISPVPKGVGPMTIALLMHNTYKAFLKAAETKVKTSKNKKSKKEH